MVGVRWRKRCGWGEDFDDAFSLWLPIQVAVNRFRFSAFSAAINGTAFESKKKASSTCGGGRRFLNEVAVLPRRFSQIRLTPV